MGGICFVKWGLKGWQSRITRWVAMASIAVITVGAIPRVLLTTNLVLGTNLPNLNRGIGAYAFWFGEVAGLSLTFGAYPLVLIAYYLTDSAEEAELGLTTDLAEGYKPEGAAPKL